MRIAVSNIAWDPSEDEVVGETLRALGVDAVELAHTKYWPVPVEPSTADLAELAGAWKRRGQSILALQSLLFGRPDLSIFGEPAQTAETATYLERVLEIGAGLGAKVLVFGSPRNRDRGERSFPQALAEATAFFRPLAERARTLGCVIGLEPNPPIYGCNFVTNTEEAIELIRAIDHPGFRLHLDVGILHLNGENPGHAVKQARPYLAHVHISEPELASVPAGKVDHRAAAEALRAEEWDGAVSIEMRGGPPGGENLERVREAAAFARETYQ